MSKKKYQYRIEKKADGVYIIKERHTFMFFWSFWTTGSIRFKIAKQYASPQLAEDAIVKRKSCTGEGRRRVHYERRQCQKCFVKTRKEG